MLNAHAPYLFLRHEVPDEEVKFIVPFDCNVALSLQNIRKSAAFRDLFIIF